LVVLQVLLLLLVAPLPVQHHLRTIISIVNHNSREPITHDTSSQSHLGTLLLEGGVVAGVGGERLVAEVDDVRADLVQEGDVVRRSGLEAVSMFTAVELFHLLDVLRLTRGKTCFASGHVLPLVFTRPSMKHEAACLLLLPTALSPKPPKGRGFHRPPSAIA
jgi:hypothetical protein